ncbi:hypothetical protein IGI04_042097 [Brassica rapa subsp. trilocularis]|uniref:DUF4283 domain-containing protein n=1 Tax=Brassica rapa subsp. trilocularis TaxID=1813537 RepID=A0ABQ7KVH8_BRACM|nr:hypothetical protein IGI04_042097 [Brassica rapa subsp. trilocularis]
MANPWFPANSASALSPPLLTPGDRRFLAPPDPPDPDPDNPLSLARFPPLNSPSSLTSNSSKTSRTLLQSCSVTAPKSSSVPPTESFNGKTSTSAISDPVLPRSGNTVPNFDNFKILPPKTSSPIHTNRASNLLPKLPPPSEAPQNANHNPKTVPNPNPVPVFQVPPFTHVPLQTKPTNTESSLAPVTVSDSGRPRVLIPESVFQKGAELHKDFIICYFNGRPPPFNHTQNVLNHLWEKGTRVEIHTNPHTRSMLVRIPSDYLRQKILEKRVWYIGDSMFQAVQWTSSASTTSPPLESIQIWAHLKGIPLDLRHEEGLSLIAGLVGDPKETDDFTLNLVSLTMSHVKVAVDLTKPLPSVVEYTRQSGEVVEVLVTYPWVPPTCSHCNELGHIMKNCLQQPPPKQNPPRRQGKEVETNDTAPKSQRTSKSDRLNPASGPKKVAESSSSVPPEKSSAASYTPHKSSAASPTPHKPPSPLHEPPVSTPTCLPPAVTPLPLIVQPPKMSHPPPPNDPPSATVQPLSLFVSPTSPPEQPKKRPRPCSSQPFPSFTDQLNFFSLPKSPIRPPTPLPSISFQTSFGPNPFDVLSTHGSLPPEEVID